MLTQEEYMDVLKLQRQGFTIAEIADELGYHPATISRWIKDGGPPPARETDRSELVIDHFWLDRVKTLLEANPRLLATSVFAIISAEGFEGSCPTVSRYVRVLRGPRFRRADRASVPIETAPGEECQFDWSDCCDFGELFGLGELHCFGAILSWSRWRKWWFAPSIDQNHTLEGLASFYEAAGGVPYFSRTDRMGALGSSRGRRFVLHPAVLDFARLHGTAMVVCAPRDARRVRPALMPPAPAPLPRSRAKAPYSAKEVGAYLALATAQPTEARRQRLTGLLCLGLGAGIQAAELRYVTGNHLRRQGGALVVNVEGRHPRRVPVLARYEEPLSTSATYAGTGFVCGGVLATRKHLTTRLVDTTAGGSDLPRLDIGRLRATWLCEQLERLGVPELLTAAGVTHSQRIWDLVSMLPAPSEASMIQRLG